MKNESSPLEKENIEKEFQILQKENFEEHEKWQIKLKEVVSAMQKKNGALKDVVTAMQIQLKNKTEETNDIHVLIIVLGGGMQGSYGAGQMSALQEMGYTTKNLDEKDVFIGISAGAPTCAFGMSDRKQVLLGTSYFYTICASPEFLKYTRLNQIMNISVVEKALRDEPTKINVKAVMKNKAQFYVQAFNETTNSPELINAKDPKIDMIEAIHASMAIPVVYDKEITIGKSKYTDGAFDDPLPLTRAIEKFKPTHILILPNIAFNKIPLEKSSKIEKTFMNIIPDKGSMGFLRKVLNHRQALRKTLDSIATHHNVKIGIAWPPEMNLHVLIQDREKIKVAIKASAKEIFDLFGEKERSLKLYEEEYPKI